MAQGFWNPQGRVGPLNNSAPVGGQPSTTGVSADGGYSPPAGMGYAGFSPVALPGTPTLGTNQASPVQLPGGWGQPSQGAAQGAAQGMGGVLGAMTPNPSRAMQVYGSSPVPGMDNRTFQMMARYLPNSGTGVDPVASPGTVRNRYGGDWTKMVPQKLQGQFQQFQDAMGGMTDYNQFRAYQGRPEINYGGQGTRWNPWSNAGGDTTNPVIGAMIRRRQQEQGGGVSPGMSADPYNNGGWGPGGPVGNNPPGAIAVGGYVEPNKFGNYNSQPQFPGMGGPTMGATMDQYIGALTNFGDPMVGAPTPQPGPTVAPGAPIGRRRGL